MKKFLEKPTLKGVFAGFLVCCLFGVVVFADHWNVKFLDTWGSTKKDNKLSAETWDAVLAELDQLRVDLDNALKEPSIGIPTGAIMAFESTCPTGWVEYTAAEGKFLMGVSESSTSLFGTVGGSSGVTLTAKNLPQHSHFYKDTVFAESYFDDDQDVGYPYIKSYYYQFNEQLLNKKISLLQLGDWDFPGYGLQSCDTVPWACSYGMMAPLQRGSQPYGNYERYGVIAGSNEGLDYDNYPIYGIRKTSNTVCDTSDFRANAASAPKVSTVDGQFQNINGMEFYNSVQACDSGAATPVKLEPLHVKVVYCKKVGDGGNRGAQNTQPQANAKCTYNGTQYNDGATVNGIYDILELTCANSSTHCTTKSATCNNGKWEINGSPVPHIYSSCSVVSNNPKGYTAESCSCGSSAYGLVAYNNNSACKYVYKCNSCGGGGGGGTCFLAGTKVLTDKGTKNIELLKAGDLVLSYNEETASNEYKKVVRPIIHENISEDLYELSINGDLLKATSSHPFYVLGNINDNKSTDLVLKLANELVIGDILLMSDGRTVSIDGISHYPYSGTVYNIEVEDNHNYYVGEGYLVHNKVAPAELYEGINPYD